MSANRWLPYRDSISVSPDLGREDVPEENFREYSAFEGNPGTLGQVEPGFSGGLKSTPVRFIEEIPRYTSQRPGVVSPLVTFAALSRACMYLLLGSAIPRFPFTRVSAPSEIVRIDKTPKPLINPADAALFPMNIDWKRWRECVVPVLHDEEWNAHAPLNASQIATRTDEYLRRLESALRRSFADAGYLPESFV